MRLELRFLFTFLLCVSGYGFAANLMMTEHEGIIVQLDFNNPDGSVNVKIYGALEFSHEVIEAWNKFENVFHKSVKAIAFMNLDGSVHQVMGANEPHVLFAED